MQLTKYPDQSEDLPKVEKCYLCGKWLVIGMLFSVKVQDQGNSWIVKPACRKCVKEAGFGMSDYDLSKSSSLDRKRLPGGD
jgi:hypothetical protein